LAHAGEPVLSVVLAQAGTPFRVRVPLRVHHERGHVDFVVEMSGSQARAQIPLPARALFIELDPDVRVFRRLHPEEIAPTLRQVLLDPETRVAIAAADENARAAALRVAQAALENEVRLLDPERLQARTPLLIVGLHAEVGAFLARSKLPQPAVPGAAHGAAIAYAWRTPDGRNFVVAAAANAGQLAALSRPLPHLGGRSYAVFDGARSSARGLWPTAAIRYPVTD
jgi:aminopeptidase N